MNTSAIKVEPVDSHWYSVRLSSGDGEEYKGCTLTVVGFRRYLTLKLPAIIKPKAEKVYPKSWDAATVARLGRNWYWQYTERQYGMTLFENHFSIHYGLATDSSRTEQRWGCFLPWMEWRFHRMTLYDLHWQIDWTQLEDERGGKGFKRYEVQSAAEARVPKAGFSFKDFDGEVIRALTHLEQREWRRGRGWFKWLSHFYAPKIRYSLAIEFSSEMGPKKGSWKGGTLGHSIETTPGESHETAFRRYCLENNMEFIGAADASPIHHGRGPEAGTEDQSGDCRSSAGKVH